MKIRIRGIYATALTYMLSKNFEIVQQSPQIAERFMQEIIREPADITFKDGEDKGSLIVIGIADNFENYLKEIFPYSIVWKSPVKLYSLIETQNCKYQSYDVEPCLEKGIVIKPPTDGRKIILSPPKAVSKFAMVWRGEGKTFFSEHIVPEERKRLLNISIKYNKKGYNVKWRSNAQFEKNCLLEKDLENLIFKYENDDFSKQGCDFYLINLSLEDKLELDKIRSLVVPTINFHHMLKLSRSREVDIAESGKDNVTQILESLIKDYMEIEHIKINGRRIFLKPGKVIEKRVSDNGYFLLLRREISGNGYYDGLGIRKEEGDYDIMEIDSRKWHEVHNYYSKDGTLKGKYINISTPPELLDGKIRYIDLEVDIIIKNGEKNIIDKEKLEENKKYLSYKMLERIKKEIEYIMTAY
ncbi:DUF402 domain-containing protein [Acidianus ambivalens]|uniref:DUF402 domain-containing protein n=1 Tax=Acidianus ambivalens TaxID=2283 RepID=A0A650CYL0_ACIAM|nr:DUF402 domain-containing protein [Acidianus ambivalens]MQL54928.1 DUF402 domain-containing protein [Acidianus ambivalens]QGR22712.1 DUF402 domain-containing protein [Acidianus ambivalens]